MGSGNERILNARLFRACIAERRGSSIFIKYAKNTSLRWAWAPGERPAVLACPHAAMGEPG